MNDETRKISINLFADMPRLCDVVWVSPKQRERELIQLCYSRSNPFKDDLGLESNFGQEVHRFRFPSSEDQRTGKEL